MSQSANPEPRPVAPRRPPAPVAPSRPPRPRDGAPRGPASRVRSGSGRWKQFLEALPALRRQLYRIGVSVVIEEQKHALFAGRGVRASYYPSTRRFHFQSPRSSTCVLSLPEVVMALEKAVQRGRGEDGEFT